MISTASLSGDGRYRWRLSRAWDGAPWKGGHERVTFVMLNPSTADADADDPTVRKCIGFAKAWGYGALTIVNLYAYRTPYPSALRHDGYPIGHQNDDEILEGARESQLVIAAWGAWAASDETIERRALHVFYLITSPPNEIALECLGLTSGGAPRHPLMTPYATPRVPFYMRPRF